MSDLFYNLRVLWYSICYFWSIVIIYCKLSRFSYLHKICENKFHIKVTVKKTLIKRHWAQKWKCHIYTCNPHHTPAHMHFYTHIHTHIKYILQLNKPNWFLFYLPNTVTIHWNQNENNDNYVSSISKFCLGYRFWEVVNHFNNNIFGILLSGKQF